MAKIFNVTRDCKPDKHYMVKLDTRLAVIKAMVDINRLASVRSWSVTRC